MEVETQSSLRELTQASGANLGGEMVNENFIKLLKEVIGAETVEKIKREQPLAWFELINQKFEQAKKAVKSENGRGLRVDISSAIYDCFKSKVEQINAKTGEHGLRFANGKLSITHVCIQLKTCLTGCKNI